MSMGGTYFLWSSTAIFSAQSYLGRGSHSIVLGSSHDLREAFTTSRALGVQRMKEGDVLKCLVVGILRAGMDLDFHMEHYIYKRKSDNVLHHKSKENLKEASAGSLCHCPVENLADVSIISSGKTDQRVGLMFATAATKATHISGCFTSGTFTHQIQTDFWELLAFWEQPSGGYWSR